MTKGQLQAGTDLDKILTFNHKHFTDINWTK